MSQIRYMYNRKWIVYIYSRHRPEKSGITCGISMVRSTGLDVYVAGIGLCVYMYVHIYTPAVDLRRAPSTVRIRLVGCMYELNWVRI